MIITYPVPYDDSIPTIFEVGMCFKRLDEEHFYMQRTNDVLHINKNLLCINALFVNELTSYSKLELIEITKEEFMLVVKETIYNLELNEFWS